MLDVYINDGTPTCKKDTKPLNASSSPIRTISSYLDSLGRKLGVNTNHIEIFA